MMEEVTLQTSTGAAKGRDESDEPGTPVEQGEPDETGCGSEQDAPWQPDTEQLQE